MATTESPLDNLQHHRKLRDSGWKGRVISTYRPDPVVDPEFEGFAANVQKLGELTGEETASWPGYLKALAQRRKYFAETWDHGYRSWS